MMVDPAPPPLVAVAVELVRLAVLMETAMAEMAPHRLSQAHLSFTLAVVVVEIMMAAVSQSLEVTVAVVLVIGTR
jgi:hypothetical protein